MAEKPMPLMTEKNRALIRANLKWQTRRVIVPQPHEVLPNRDGGEMTPYRWVPKSNESAMYGDYEEIKPRYQVGDELWMREPYRIINKTYNIDRSLEVHYFDDRKYESCLMTLAELQKWSARKKPFAKTSPLFMYKSLSRTRRKVIRVWVERVQDISVEDAKAEGITLIGDELVFNNEKQKQALIITNFSRLWDSLNAKPRPFTVKGKIVRYKSYPWDDTGKYAKMETYQGKPHVCYPNPYNFCYSFEEIEK